ncbi:LuxR C-terminal-related transcriptional regulator [Streptomyces platensis]|uniref:response regulator transcription factor n=1 Tax=Streptomyces TaxID=1883 RepID=UPI002001E194|nr:MULTISPECIES: LuxR C-terminal-related transcriptional regulator [Streptomyces]MCX4638680.1 LuxR C-terminal-related transcriptional regulator [Streptomyces platensis]
MATRRQSPPASSYGRLSNAEIGRELAMSEGTVKAHVSRALAKLNLANRVQMALLVRDAGLT